MAIAVHGCSSSPRHRHSFNSDCRQQKQAFYQQQQQQQQQQRHNTQTLNNSNSSSMYTTMPKYTRTSGQSMTAPNHHGSYMGTPVNATPGGANQYGAPLYMSLATATATAGASTQQQRPLSASAVGENSIACRNYWSHQHPAAMLYRSGRHYSKRKSAVELLAESKPFYIKSDAVFERLQQSNYRNVGTTMSSSAKRGRRPDDGRYNPTYGEFEDRRYGTAAHVHHQSSRAVSAAATQQQQGPQSAQHMHHHHHHGHHTHSARHSAPPNNNLLQNKLRMLLGAEGGKERGRNSLRKYELDGSRQELNTLGYDDEDSAALRIPPPLFMTPQPYSNVYSYSGDCSSGEEPLVLTENYRPISPPAEYAAKSSQTQNERYRYNYQRSYSHSHEMGGDERAQYAAVDYNINSHKSLPDLHTQISRHSPHSEILSCCSRGNRSIKSAGESSLNRDSGGSSGHYTHRSEPCYQRQREAAEREHNPNAVKNCCNMVTRRDSGSSTQHSANSYCGYATPAAYPPPANMMARSNGVGDCAECRCKHETMNYTDSSDYLLNFTTPEVPEAFQDDYTPPSPRIKELTPRYSSSSSQQHHSSQGYTSINHSQSSLVQSPGSAPSVEDISPPPIQFKRQRCIRFKNRSRLTQSRASLNTDATNGTGTATGTGTGTATRGSYQSADHDNVFFPKGFSNSSVADEYKHQQQQQQQQQQLQTQHNLSPMQLTQAHSTEHIGSMELSTCDNNVGVGASNDAGLGDLEKFFDRLGLNDEMFHEIYSQPKRRHSAETDSDDSSTVFFSDVSTVDSMRLPDSTETQPQTQTQQPYRPSEPPSIVERNARIIKWLCNCKKLQYA